MSFPPEERRRVEVVLRLAQQAGKAVLDRLNDKHLLTRKTDRSLVTEADLESDRLIREGLAKNFPNDAILSEETGLSGEKKSPWVWCVDPLDGTKAFAKKIPGFCVMIGLLHRGQPHLGVVVDPLDGHAYYAVRGMGAFHQFQGKLIPIQVSKRKDWAEMPLVISTGFPENKLADVRKTLNGPLIEPINSVGIKVGLLVRQVGDIYINHHSVHFWDTCAPQVILEEAGGEMTRLDGLPLQYSLEGNFSHHASTLASNGKRHSDLVEVLKTLSL